MSSMRVYVQSYSGDLNSDITVKAMIDMTAAPEDRLRQVIKILRDDGGYLTVFRNQKVIVPFHEIKYIREIEEVQNEQA